MSAGRSRRLTPRQTAVLAAVERRGRATLPDLREDFPQLAPSAVAKVLDALGQRDLVRRSGDPHQIYLGGVTFWASSREPPEQDPRLEGLAKMLEVSGWPSETDHERGVVSLFLPLRGLLGYLASTDDDLERLRSAVATWLTAHEEGTLRVRPTTRDDEPGVLLELEPERQNAAS